MFIPKEFEFNDKGEIIDFINRYNFGTIVSVADGLPQATHLPFHFLERNGQMVLTAHFAKANIQWQSIEDQTVLVIFSEPHAYISPVHYEHQQNVPTWNYIAVHVYGRGQVIQDKEKGLEILEQMIIQSEPAYKSQWDALDEKYKLGLYNGIVPFEIIIERWTAAGKLSQNKTDVEKTSIISTLEKSKMGAERDIAEYMNKLSLKADSDEGSNGCPLGHD